MGTFLIFENFKEYFVINHANIISSLSKHANFDIWDFQNAPIKNGSPLNGFGLWAISTLGLCLWSFVDMFVFDTPALLIFVMAILNICRYRCGQQVVPRHSLCLLQAQQTVPQPFQYIIVTGIYVSRFYQFSTRVRACAIIPIGIVNLHRMITGLGTRGSRDKWLATAST